MNDSLTKLLNYIEPKIGNLEDERREERLLKRVYESLGEIVSEHDKSYLNIVEYYDQDFIMRTIKINCDTDMINNYKSSVYLLQNKTQEIKELPQYKDALLYMDKLLNYLESFYQKITLEYHDKKTNLNKLKLLNKYYLLLNKENIIIDNPIEFMEFLNCCDIENQIKLDTLVLVNEANIKSYTKTNDIYLTKDLLLSDITNLLLENKHLINEDLLNIDNYLLDNNDLNKQKEYLITKINKLYLDNKYQQIIDYYLNYQEVCKKLKEIISQDEIENLDVVKE